MLRLQYPRPPFWCLSWHFLNDGCICRGQGVSSLYKSAKMFSFLLQGAGSRGYYRATFHGVGMVWTWSCNNLHAPKNSDGMTFHDGLRWDFCPTGVDSWSELRSAGLEDSTSGGVTVKCPAIQSQVFANMSDVSGLDSASLQPLQGNPWDFEWKSELLGHISSKAEGVPLLKDSSPYCGL